MKRLWILAGFLVIFAGHISAMDAASIGSGDSASASSEDEQDVDDAASIATTDTEEYHPVIGDFEMRMADVQFVLDTVEGVLIGRDNKSGLRSLRCVRRQYLKAEVDRDYASLVLLIQGLREIAQQVLVAGDGVRDEINHLIGHLENLDAPEGGRWIIECEDVTEKIYMFIDRILELLPVRLQDDQRVLAAVNDATNKIDAFCDSLTPYAAFVCAESIKVLPDFIHGRAKIKHKQAVLRLINELMSLSAE